jgi:hypothetical protein
MVTYIVLFFTVATLADAKSVVLVTSERTPTEIAETFSMPTDEYDALNVENFSYGIFTDYGVIVDLTFDISLSH